MTLDTLCNVVIYKCFLMHTIYFFPLLPWAAHMSQNWEFMPKIWLNIVTLMFLIRWIFQECSPQKLCQFIECNEWYIFKLAVKVVNQMPGRDGKFTIINHWLVTEHFRNIELQIFNVILYLTTTIQGGFYW